MTQNQVEQPGLRQLQQEMLTRPLNRSVLGNVIVKCLTLPWTTAPSGLACCEMPVDGDWDVSVVADAINALACGAQAYCSPFARILGVRDVGSLNTMLSRSGLTTICPFSTPKPWYVLMVRQPPDFVCEGFLKAHKPQFSTSSGCSSTSVAPSLSHTMSPPLTRTVSADVLGKPTRTMEQLIEQLRNAPPRSKLAYDLATALILAERERFRTQKVPLAREIHGPLRMAEKIAQTDSGPITEEPFEYKSDHELTPPRTTSLPRDSRQI